MVDTSDTMLMVYVGRDTVLNVNDISSIEWNSLTDRVDALEALELDDLADVDTTGVTDGKVLAWDDADSTWKPTTMLNGLSSARDSTGTIVMSDVRSMLFNLGLTAYPHGTTPNVLIVEPTFGTAANTIAPGNHTHPLRVDDVLSFAASGTFSSGNRTLVTGTVSGLDATRSYLIKPTLYVHMRGDGAGAGYVMPSVTVNASTVNGIEDARLVAGVLVTEVVPHQGLIVTGVTSVTVSAAAAFISGDAAYIGAGKILVSIEANR